MKQTSIVSTASTERSNIRHVRASQFLRLFNLDVRHKPGKEHIVPDALSRLASANRDASINSEDYSELDCLTHVVTSVQMNDDLRKRIKEGYEEDPAWNHIMEILDSNKGPNRTRLPFVYGKDLPSHETDPYFEPRPNSDLSNDNVDPNVFNDLIYHVDETAYHRLCVPRSVMKDVFDVAHGDGYPGYERCFQIIARSWYVRRLGRHLREYLRHCPECLVYQTRRHQPYGSLQPILTPSVPFHTITPDFIVSLSESYEGLDTILSCTDKFTRRITLIAGVNKWKAKDWALALLDRLAIADWGLPSAIISDRDRKFVSKLWETIFRLLGVNLLFSTAYHPQTDGRSEKTNEISEIALRFYIHSLESP